MHAVIRTGGKQYRVTLGQQVRVDRLAGAAGDTVDLTDVLLLSDEDSTTLGTPTVENAHVVASIVEQVRGRKILVFKYKSKKRYRKLRGHRQRHTDLRIEEIVGPDGASYKHEKREHIVEEEPVAEEEAEDEKDEAAVDEASSDEAAVDEAEVDETTVDEAKDETTEDDTAVDEVEDDASKNEAPADENDEAADDSEAEQDTED
ncbi:MAG: 50S ribosomal protein L21 [Chloroflexi bacterium]|nr:50S ribosomal protein L21 [Chloroflexota bacterium]